jgi:hypothetical protein
MKRLILILFMIIFIYSCRDNGKYKITCMNTLYYQYCEDYKVEDKYIYMYDINNDLIGICNDNWYVKKLKE